MTLLKTVVVVYSETKNTLQIPRRPRAQTTASLGARARTALAQDDVPAPAA